MKKFAIIGILIFTVFTLFSQETKKNVTGAKGRCQLVGSISYDDAKAKALAEAKTDALKLAGVAEHIQSYDMLYKSEIGNKYEEFFSSDMQSEIRGAVSSYNITSETTDKDETKILYIELTIDAEVIIYSSSPYPAFKVNIDGINKGYKNG